MNPRNRKIVRTLICVAMCLVCFAATSFAATKPISGPWGITLDSKGNLYVANYSGNEVLVYNPSYKQTKVITSSINGPTGVSFDPYGNYWVSNINGNTVNQYSPTGALLSQLTSENSVNFPTGVSVDGVGNVWVQNNDNQVLMFCPALVNQIIGSATASQLLVGYFLGIATHGSEWVVGTDQGMEIAPIELFVLINSNENNPISGLNGNALAFDATGNIYSGNLDGTVDYYNVTSKSSTLFTTVGYPKGIAVDGARGRVYIADFINNAVQVYSTSGALLTTIK